MTTYNPTIFVTYARVTDGSSYDRGLVFPALSRDDLLYWKASSEASKHFLAPKLHVLPIMTESGPGFLFETKDTDKGDVIDLFFRDVMKTLAETAIRHLPANSLMASPIISLGNPVYTTTDAQAWDERCTFLRRKVNDALQRNTVVTETLGQHTISILGWPARDNKDFLEQSKIKPIFPANNDWLNSLDDFGSETQGTATFSCEPSAQPREDPTTSDGPEREYFVVFSDELSRS